jgi:hypothetical protein
LLSSIQTTRYPLHLQLQPVDNDSCLRFLLFEIPQYLAFRVRLQHFYYNHLIIPYYLVATTCNPYSYDPPAPTSRANTTHPISGPLQDNPASTHPSTLAASQCRKTIVIFTQPDLVGSSMIERRADAQRTSEESYSPGRVDRFERRIKQTSDQQTGSDKGPSPPRTRHINTCWNLYSDPILARKQDLSRPTP